MIQHALNIFCTSVAFDVSVTHTGYDITQRCMSMPARTSCVGDVRTCMSVHIDFVHILSSLTYYLILLLRVDVCVYCVHVSVTYTKCLTVSYRCLPPIFHYASGQIQQGE